jgi:FkbM family methyltransferase
MGVDRNDGVQWAIFKTAKWDDEVSEALISRWSTDDVFYDIGANIGYFTLLALERSLKKVISFEPFVDLAELASRNITINGYLEDRFVVEVTALGAKNEARAYLPGPNSNSGAGRLAASDEQSSVNVAVESLDSYIERSCSPKPTVIKLDVEGGEYDVLLGAQNLLSTEPPHTIVFEADCHPDFSLVNVDIYELLRDSGYIIEHLPRAVTESKENYLAKLK